VRTYEEIDMPVDYRDSIELFVNTDPNAGH